ncbi:hypothetical protein [Reyranella sp.]|uniref:hypothetical protein n=1 Tax=Reyranella sp. TaxID=1929291 RepID=UPI0025E5C373|nr:hypothetical protein [Reyranella sp.]
MSIATFTLVHVLLSVIGIAGGLIVMERFLRNRVLGLSNTIFLVATILTSATGFLFPSKDVLTPAQMLGVTSLVVLAIAAIALYFGNLIGAWRWIYVVTATMALYFNVFVAVVQAFQKVGRLRMLAPTQTEPPFIISQAAVLAFFLILAVIALRRFRPPTA